MKKPYRYLLYKNEQYVDDRRICIKIKNKSGLYQREVV